MITQINVEKRASKKSITDKHIIFPNAAPGGKNFVDKFLKV